MNCVPSKKELTAIHNVLRKALRPPFAHFLWPLIFLLAATFLIGLTGADLFLSGLFYNPETGWQLARNNPWDFTYHYGMIPAFALGFGGLGIFLSGFFYKKLLPYRKSALFLVIFLVVGPGLVVNTIFKDHWGRPRPADIVNFGGDARYQPCWKLGAAGKGKSFPSGHASIGFFVFAPYFFLRRKNPRIAIAFLALGIAYGSLMGLGRIVQGGHFISDVVWSGGITYLTGLALSHLFGLEREGCDQET